MKYEPSRLISALLAVFHRTEIKRYKKRIDDADTQRQCLEEKVQYLRMQAKEAEDAKAQVTSLRTKLDRLQR